jgi:hypothetical protein
LHPAVPYRNPFPSSLHPSPTPQTPFLVSAGGGAWGQKNPKTLRMEDEHVRIWKILETVPWNVHTSERGHRKHDKVSGSGPSLRPPFLPRGPGSELSERRRLRGSSDTRVAQPPAPVGLRPRPAATATATATRAHARSRGRGSGG